jgi:diadenylate cyclase
MIETLKILWRPAVEVLILAVAIYYVAVFVRGTRGAAIFTGMLVLLLALGIVTHVLDLQVLRWIVGLLTPFFAIAVVVIFQPELRRMLAQLGNVQLFSSTREQREDIEVIIQTVERLADVRIGALMAIEQTVQLNEYVESGILVDCEATPEMLECIFFPNNAIHDGGVILKNGRITHAACIFPLSRRPELNKSLGTRHRAALGLSEETDALIVAVSEENGMVSYASKGQLVRGVSLEELRAFLTAQLVPSAPRPRNLPDWLRSLFAERTRSVTPVVTRNEPKPNEASRPHSA